MTERTLDDHEEHDEAVVGASDSVETAREAGSADDISKAELLAFISQHMAAATADFWQKVRESKESGADDADGAARRAREDACFSLYEDDEEEDED